MPSSKPGAGDQAGCAQRIAALLGRSEPRLQGPSGPSGPSAPSVPAEPIHNSTEHLQFLEHMLLEEFVAPDRGNTVIKAIRGFQQFWKSPVGVTFVPEVEAKAKSTPIATASASSLEDIMAAELAKDKESKGSLTTSILRKWGGDTEYPRRLVIIAGPGGATPHAVAFLITQKTPQDQHKIHYANTGLGAKTCGKGLIKTTCRWDGTKIVPLIEYARHTVLNNDQFDRYVTFLEKVPGFNDVCLKWDPSVTDRTLTLAQYAKKNGTIVSFPQRGGTCTYNCVLWLVGGILLTKDAAVKAERSMKIRGMQYLAAYRPSEGAKVRVETRNCLRVMEAAAHAYKECAWCTAEAAALARAVDESFESMSTWMHDAYDEREYTHKLPKLDRAKIDFDLDPEQFETAEEAAVWSEQAYNWIIAVDTEELDAIHVPLYYLFLHKARTVLCVDPPAAESPETIVRIAKFLAKCRGPITEEVARGMLARCARLAAIPLRSQAKSTGWDVRLQGAIELSSLPWVAQEHRSLLGETAGLAHLLVTGGDISGSGSETDKRPDITCDAKLVFTPHNVTQPLFWNAFAAKMSDPSHAALNITLIFLSFWGSGWGHDADMVVKASDGTLKIKSTSGSGWNTVELVIKTKFQKKGILFHGAPKIVGPMRTYLHLSTLDVDAMSSGFRVASSAKSEETRTPAAMVVPVYHTDQIAIGDVDELDKWGELEHASWTSDIRTKELRSRFREMAARRGLAYCAAKFLTPACRRRGPLDNLDALIAENEDKDPASELFRALRDGRVETLVARLRGTGSLLPHESLALHYAVARDQVKNLVPQMTTLGEADTFPQLSNLPIVLTAANGARNENGMLTVTQAGRRLAFVCEGMTACATARAAMLLANVPFLHWESTSGVDTIEACGTTITFGRKASIPDPAGKGDYAIDWAPSEWSSAWYTTVHAAVFPVRRDGALSLAVFVCSAQNTNEAAEAIHFSCSLDDLRGARVPEAHLGTHFVVPFDAAGVMPVCTPLQARTLLCAYGRGSICAVRLMPMVALDQRSPTAACIYSTYAQWALGVGSLEDEVRESARFFPKKTELTLMQWCIATLEDSGPSASEETEPPPRPEGPMDHVRVRQEAGTGLFRLGEKPPEPAKRFVENLESMRDANRRRWRFCFGLVRYGAEERATAYLAASIDAARHCASGEERLGVLMSTACLAPYHDKDEREREVRASFEAASGKFLTERQSALVRSMSRYPTKSAVQLNMGFGKSKVVVPMLVMLLIDRYHCVVVTQPPHLVAEATRVICAALAARPFVRAEVVRVTNDSNAALLVREGRVVVVCSGTDLQGTISGSLKVDAPRHERVPMYNDQLLRAHIADEIDETSDPLTCERSETTGAPKAHYAAVDALTYHKAVCDLVVAERDLAENDHEVVLPANSAQWYVRLASIAKLTKSRKLNVNFGLVDTDGVYLAVPYKYAQTPSHGSRYSDLDVSAILTARAVYAACHKRGAGGPAGPRASGLSASAQKALVRALTDAIGESAAREALEKVTSEQLFRLHATLVALRQVVCFETETVTSFVDVLGIASAFAAFSGTMALDLPVPNVPPDDPRKWHMPPVVGERNDAVLLVTPDHKGNALVKKNIGRATCKPIRGAHTPERAGSVVGFLEGASKNHTQMVIVDASGEFGVIATPEFLAKARGFDEAGKLAPRKRSTDVVDVVYYDHKHSRGTDATLDFDAHGYVVVDWAVSTLTAAAQAMYRLRGIDYEVQRITFVVCGLDTSLTGDQLYAQLEENEKVRAARASARSEIHRKRAASYWESTAWFSNKIEHEPIPDERADHDREQTQTQTQTQEQQQTGGDQCIRLTQPLVRIDPLTLYKQHEYGEQVSNLIPSLRATHVHVSPLLMSDKAEHAALERAFVVVASGKAEPTVVLCTLVELWARSFNKQGSQREAYVAYTARGSLVRRDPGATASAGDVLFGRFLCGDSLTRAEQVSLFEYMKRRYVSIREKAYTQHVLACLVSSRIMPAPAGILDLLIQDSNWDRHDSSQPSPDVAFVRALLATKAQFGPRRDSRRFI